MSGRVDVMTDELRKSFHSELDDIREDITRLAASVIEAIPRATQVLLDGDLEGADYLLLADQEIDARSLDLEERCYQVLALQAPVAVDLRQVMAAVKMIGEIERSGDLVREHLQGGAAHLRRRARPSPARPHQPA